MVQIVMALAVVAALVYFVFFRTGGESETQQAQPYAEEVQQAEDVEQQLMDAQQQQQRNIEEQSQ